MLAERYCTYVALLYEPHYFAFGKRVLLTTNLNVTYVARHAKRYEYHQFVPVEQTFAFCCYGLDSNVF
jgi:hypothetical protein